MIYRVIPSVSPLPGDRNHLTEIFRKLALPVLALCFWLGYGTRPLVAAPWEIVRGGPVTVEAAAAYYAAQNQGLVQAQSAAPRTKSGESHPAEIQDLARGLGHDPLAIYNYVRNRIEYRPYWGLRKGALNCLLDESGNDFDQAALLKALLEASGFDAAFIHGEMNMSTAALGNWLGVENNLNLISTFLSYVGIPYTAVGGSTLKVSRVWVTVHVEGKDYQLDAAYHTNEVFPLANIATMMGYNRDTLLTTAQAGATVTADYVQNLNINGLRALLNQYSTNLATALRAQYPNAEIWEVLGGIHPVTTLATSLDQGLHFGVKVLEQWETVPPAYLDTLRIRIHGIDRTFQSAEIAGKRLSLTFNPSGLRPELRLNGELLAQGNTASSGQDLTATFNVDHPLAWNSGTYTDVEVTRVIPAVAGPIYCIVHDATQGSSDGAIAAADRRLAAAVASGLPRSSEAVNGETLNMVGLRYLRQCSQANELGPRLIGVRRIQHHELGVVSNRQGVVVDWFSGVISNFQIKGGVSEERVMAFSLTAWGLGSAYEHAVMEQLHAGRHPGVSTMKFLQRASQDGNRVFLARSSNYAAVQPQLSGYDSYYMSNFQSHVNANGFILLGANGNKQFGEWSGSAWLAYGGIDSVAGYLISGHLNGGYATTSEDAELDDIFDWLNEDDYFEDDSGQSLYGPASFDPVDLKTGFWFTNKDDLTLGSGRVPTGLKFTRNYSSGSARSLGALGHGWSHDYEVAVSQTSSGLVPSGGRSAVDAVSFLVYMYAFSDVFEELVKCPFGNCAPSVYGQDVLGHMLLVLGTNWFTDQTVNNIARVTIGDSSREYVLLPDGSYNSPAGDTSTLVKLPDGRFTLTTRDGEVWHFNLENRLERVVDIDGNEMLLTYGGPGGKLTQVRDAYLRTLTLAYTGDRLTSVTDSAGRTVGYGYSAENDLTTFTDADSHPWTYAYDQHRLTQAQAPDGGTLVTNTYNSLNQVATQLLPRQPGNAEYQFLFGQFRSVEIDPLGNRTTYYYDKRGRTLSVEDALGQVRRYTYDGQDHLTSTTDERGNRTSHAFDGRQNRVKTTDAAGHQTQFTYNAQNLLTRVRDPLGRDTNYTWDAKRKPVTETDSTNRTTAYTYDARGRLATATDPSGVVVTSGYDAFGNRSSFRVGAHDPVTMSSNAIGQLLSLTDQLGAVTTFTYNHRGLRTTQTDPKNRVFTSSYDSRGRLLSTQNRRGQTISYNYTVADKVAQVNLPAGEQLTYTYDLLDRLTQVTESAGSTTYTYDALRRPLSRTDVHGLQVRQTYDPAGNLSSLVYPGELEVRYTYDVLNRLVSVKQWLGGVTDYDRDALGRLLWRNSQGHTNTTLSYDGQGRLTGKTAQITASNGAPLSSHTLTYDARGMLASLTQTQPVAPVLPAAQDTLVYNANGYELQSVNAAPVSHDADGQQTSRSGGAETLGFDARGRLTQRQVNGAGHVYTYDYEGNRVARSMDGVETRYLYDLQGNLIAELDAANTPVRYFVHGQLLEQAITPQGQAYTYHCDHNGNIIALTGENGELTHGYAYAPGGRVVNQVEAFPQPFTFVGALGVMREGELYYMRARYYDPLAGRFLSEDPLGFEGDGPNLYAYALNDPLMRSDPLGLATDRVKDPLDSPKSFGTWVLGYALTGFGYVTAAEGAIMLAVGWEIGSKAMMWGGFGTFAFGLTVASIAEGEDDEAITRYGAWQDYNQYGDFVSERQNSNLCR
jgi:RHS repeat-associated protein